jgi:predicted metal-dependent hydrolase
VANRPARRIIEYGGRTIPIELSFSDRNRLSISVHPDLRVTVSAPSEKSEEKILERVRRRARWIIRQIDRFEEYRPLPPPKKYVSGETFRYLGRQYRLKVVEDQRESVKLVGRFLWARLPERENRVRVESLVEQWYRRHARVVFSRKIDELHERARIHGVPKPDDWRAQKMRSRWGSCGRSGRILLNLELLKAPLSCIEYVIAHEMCHLKELNHTKEFYRLLGLVMPDWKERKRRLDEFVL